MYMLLTCYWQFIHLLFKFCLFIHSMQSVSPTYQGYTVWVDLHMDCRLSGKSHVCSHAVLLAEVQRSTIELQMHTSSGICVSIGSACDKQPCVTMMMVHFMWLYASLNAAKEGKWVSVPLCTSLAVILLFEAADMKTEPSVIFWTLSCLCLTSESRYFDILVKAAFMCSPSEQVSAPYCPQSCSLKMTCFVKVYLFCSVWSAVCLIWKCLKILFFCLFPITYLTYR